LPPILERLQVDPTSWFDSVLDHFRIEWIPTATPAVNASG
jgi:hypothetical protein